ncbi:MAG TPA: Nramp family divalent metal transporter [Mycobacteriales bacterium]|nr:Nramp family divalent metal transporter [Mycobacteriales bacterium]
MDGSMTATQSATQSPSALQTVLTRGRWRGPLSMLGPAFVAAIAYVDPGNFATNVQSGSQFGYRLLWVVLLANLMAMPIQYLSAKLGIVTGQSLPELCRERFPKPVARALWVQAEIVAMATDLAEFVGAALGLNLLFGVPLVVAALITAVISFVLLGLQSRGFRNFELAIIALLALIIIGFLYQTLQIGPDASQSLAGFVPSFAGGDSVLLAVGIVGATAMPHVIYLHSALVSHRVPPRDDAERHRVLRLERADVLIALSIAGLVNMAILAIAAKLFHGTGHDSVSTIVQAHDELGRLVGGGAALTFAVALLASGLSSSSVGTLSGQVVMQGFIGVRVPLILRRLITMLPAIILLALHLDPTRALVLSQVVLSFGIPFALIPLVLMTRDRTVMGRYVNGRVMTLTALTISALIIGMNVLLLANL